MFFSVAVVIVLILSGFLIAHVKLNCLIHAKYPYMELTPLLLFQYKNLDK